ncbi:MAG TPA: hypothetical protein VNW92_19875, partial [Polyangiaceae bacterium]|nr:hypothetical protein [Polyangiaceae bacterium]
MKRSTSAPIAYPLPGVRARLGALGAVLAFGCSSKLPEVTKPTPPDLSSVIASYDAPTAPLDAQTISELIAPAHDLDTAITRLGIDQSVIDAAVQAFNARLDGTHASSAGVSRIAQGVTTSTQGYLQVTRICNGWGAEPTPDSAHNGVITLTAGFTNDTIDPIVWGTFSACKYALGGSQIELTGNASHSGDFAAYLGGALRGDQIGTEPLIFSVDIDTTVDGTDYPLTRDFKIDPS